MSMDYTMHSFVFRGRPTCGFILFHNMSVKCLFKREVSWFGNKQFEFNKWQQWWWNCLNYDFLYRNGPVVHKYPLFLSYENELFYDGQVDQRLLIQ